MSEFFRFSTDSPSDQEKGNTTKPKSEREKPVKASESKTPPRRVKAEGLLGAFLKEPEPEATKPAVKNPDKPDRPLPLSEHRRRLTDEANSTETPETTAIPTAEELDKAQSPAAVETKKPEDNTEEKLPVFNLEPDQGGFGEGFIWLDGDVATHVIDLHPAETVATDVPEDLLAVAAMAEMPAQPVFRSQPEQQHQARMQPEQPAVAVPEAAPAGGGGNIPPVEPPEAPRPHFGQSPEQPGPYAEWQPLPAATLEPEQRMAYMHGTSLPVTPNRMSNVSANVNVQPVVTKHEMQKAVDAAHHDSFVAGLFWGFVGGRWYQRRKHRKIEKAQERVRVAAHKEYENAQKGFQLTAEEQARKQAQTEREQLKTQQELEANRVLLEKLTAQKNEQAQAFLKGLPKVALGNRLDTLGSKELDEKSIPAEQASVQKGRESLDDHKELTPKALRNAAAGEVALVAAAMSQRSGTPRGNTALSTASIPSATTQGAPSVSRARTKVVATDKKQAMPTQPIWPWLIALAVVVVCLALVLH